MCRSPFLPPLDALPSARSTLVGVQESLPASSRNRPSSRNRRSAFRWIRGLAIWILVPVVVLLSGEARFGKLPWAGRSLAARAVAAEPATTRTHWAYHPLQRPVLPEPRDRQWSRNPVDRFLLAAMEARGLHPAATTDRATLARRLALTLTHLPVVAEWLEDFQTDTGPDAVERFVDRLLASPAYGERMAQPWLDLARYADTHGYHADTHREMWRWRDWVIDAFNQGRPYDEFLVEQLAGDLLPQATRDQRLATGFLRNHMIIFENGVEDEEYRVEYVMDRVTTVGTIALGQTLACARCHDHKHDPFTQVDFYRFFAYFNNVPERGVDGERGNAAPFLTVPTARQQETLDHFDRRLSDLESQLTRQLKGAADGQAVWEQSRLPTGAPLPTDAWLHFTFDNSHELSVARVQGPTTRIPGRQGEALLFGGDTWLDVDPPAREQREAGWTLAVSVMPTVDTSMTIAARVTTANTPRGWELRLERRRPTLRIVGPREGEERFIRARDPLTLRKWQSLVVRVEFHAGEARISFHAAGRPLPLTMETAGEEEMAGEQAVVPLRDSLRPVGPIRWGSSGLDDGEHFRGALDDIWMFDRPLSRDELVTLAGGDPLQEWLAIPAERRTAEQVAAIRRRFLMETSPNFLAREEQLRQLRADRDAFQRTLPTAMVMQELAKPRPTAVLERGRFDLPRQQVAAGVPRWLSPSQTSEPSNRLELARWLFLDDHPLTARVAANRFWQWQFGRGLVSTGDDFGSHGAPPSHPELLDWLACELRDGASPSTRWDIKRFQRLLVTSAAFRQMALPRLPLQKPGSPTGSASAGASRETTETAQADVENRFWTHGPSQRLPAEAIRDQALAAAGLLDRRIGGPSVFPYQPAGLWEDLAYDPQQFTAQVYRQSHGADLYRRSLYTFWKRASPPPALSTFDAPDREVCTVQRFSGRSPLQALVLMNEPGFIEAARALADQAGAAHRWEPRSSVSQAVRRVLARSPSPTELRLWETLIRDEQREFTRDSESARAWLNIGETAEPAVPGAATSKEAQAARAALAWAVHGLLCLDETLWIP